MYIVVLVSFLHSKPIPLRKPVVPLVNLIIIVKEFTHTGVRLPQQFLLLKWVGIVENGTEGIPTPVEVSLHM